MHMFPKVDGGGGVMVRNDNTDGDGQSMMREAPKQIRERREHGNGKNEGREKKNCSG